MQPHSITQSIGVIGGGSAGYLSALYLKQSLPNASVTLIESTRIPVIGVGEATTPLLPNVLHHKLGFPMQEFFQQAKPTIKLGIRFVWGKSGDHHFNTTFGPTDPYNAVFHTGKLNNLSFPSMLMEEERVPFARNGDTVKPINLSRGYAYHIDNRNFLKYLKDKLLLSGCHYIDTEIETVALTPDGSSIESLRSTTGETHTFDLFIDCSGFRSFLLGKHLKAEWIDYSSSLRTNRAVLGMSPNEGEISPYTTSATLKHGWLWNTPMQHEDHLGYVFSSKHCSDDEALNELKSHVTTINNERVIHFKPGRHAKSWSGNVVAIGNSFAFIEPLQSTGLHMILRQLRELCDRLKSGDDQSTSITQYNDSTNRSWDRLRWFVAMHFKFNNRLDTPFWQECRNDIDVSGLDEYLAYYLPNGPIAQNESHPLRRSLDIDDIFSVFAHDTILTGCGVNDTFFRDRGPRVRDDWPAQFHLQELLRSQCIGHREAITHMEQNPFEYRPMVATPA